MRSLPFHSKLSGHTRGNNVELDGFRFSILDLQAGSTFFITAHEIQIHDGVFIRLLPSEDLVFPWRKSANLELARSVGERGSMHIGAETSGIRRIGKHANGDIRRRLRSAHHAP